MGNLSNYESTEIGKSRMGQLRGFGGQAKGVADSMYALAAGYEGFRSQLDPVEDAEDIAYSDSAFDFSVLQCLPVLEMLTPEQKVYFDRYLDGLGYQPKV